MKRFFFLLSLLISFSIGQVWGAIDANSTWTATAFGNIPDGATVVIINNFGNSFANATVTKAPAKVAASFNSTTKKITVSTTGKSLDDIAWTVEQATNGTKFWVYGSTTNILGLSKTNDNNAVAVNTTSSAQYNEFVMGDNGKLLKYYNAGRYVGEYVSGSDWRSYNAENATNYKSSGTEQALTFYVLDANEGPLTPTCATPTFDPEDGETFTNDIDVEIAAESGTTIYYTTDGNDPTTSSSVYSSALNFTETTTLKAMAVKAGYDNSAVATATYTKVVPFSGSILEIVKGDFTTSSYDDNAGDHEKSGIKFTTAKVYQSGGGIQFQKTNGLLYNKTDLGEIAKIEITTVSGKSNNLVVYSGTTENPTSGAVTGSTSGSVTTYTFAAGKGFFAIKCNSTGASNVDPIKIYYTSSASSVAKPTISGTDNFLTSTTVTITQADADHIYYTTNGDAPTTSSAEYSAPFSLTETATVKAIAIKGGTSSSVAEMSFTKIVPLTTMDAIFAKATEVSTTATDVYVTFNNWVVTGVKGSNAYVTDGTKGFIIYQSSHGFAVGNILSGTAACKVQLYKGSSEITSLTKTTTGLTVTTGGTVTPVELNASGISALTGVNTGSVIKISGECTTSNDNYYIAGVQLYNTLFTFENPTAGKNYNCTGVYVQYNSTKEILPRSEADIDEIAEEGAPEAPTFSPAAGTYTSVQSVEISSATQGATIYYTTDGTTPTSASTEYTAAVSVGETMTIKAIAIKNSIESTMATAAYTINLPEDESTQKTWDLSIVSCDENPTDELMQWTATYVTMANAKGSGTKVTNYYPGTPDKTYTSTRFYNGNTLTFTPNGKQITQITFKATSSDYATALAKSTWTNGTAEANSKIVNVVVSNSGVVSVAVGGTCGFTEVLIQYTDVDESVPANPTFSPAAGSYTSAQNVEISCTTQDATIYYTTDGTTPTSASTQYSSAISVSESMTIKAIAIKESKSSSVVSAAYTINIDSRKVAESPAEGFSSISGDLSGNEISFAAYKGGASNDPNGSNTDHELRLYKYQATTNYGGYVTITAKEGCTIDQVVITVGGNCKVGYCKDAEDFPTKEDTPISVGTSSPFDSGTGLNASSVNVINLDGSNQFKIKTIKVYYTGDAVAPPTPSEDEVSDYVLVTDLAQLQAGDKVIIVASGADKAAGSAGATYRSVVDIARTPDKSHLIFGESMPTEFTLGIPNAGEYTFHDGEGYMYESGAKSVKVQADPASWTIAIGEGNIATIKATNELRYNSGSPRFTTYESGQQTLQLYRKPGFEELRPNLEQGRLYSACMTRNIIGVQGGILWDISHYEGTKVYFEEIVVSPSTPLTAGRPFILMVTGDFKVSYSGDEISVLPAPSGNSALRGTFSDMDQAAFNTVSWENSNSPIYMLVNNQLRQVADYTHTNLCTGNSLAANRAYLLYSALIPGQPNLAPGRRVMTMSVEENVATDISFSNGETINASKIIRNGQILILRDGKTFDVTGRELR